MQNIYDLQATVPRYVTLHGPHGQVTLSNKEQALQRFTLTGLDGFYGGAGVHVEDTQRQLGHGSFGAPAYRTGKYMTLRGTFTFANDRDRTIAARWLSSLYWDGELGELVADYDGLELTGRVRLDGPPDISEQGVNVLKVSVPLFAPDPFLYAAPRLYQIFPAGAGEGLVFPLFSSKAERSPDLPPVLDWGAGAPAGGAFANSGNADAHPTYTVHGSWPAGFRITTGSKVVEYPAPVVPSHPVVIDHKTGSVSVSGVDQTYRLSRRDWVAVPPGEAIQPRITALAPSTGWCDVTISSTYI